MKQKLEIKKIPTDKLISYLEFNATKEELINIRSNIDRILEKHTLPNTLFSSFFSKRALDLMNENELISKVAPVIFNNQKFIDSFITGNRLQCTKIIKESTGLGLIESKDIVDSIFSIHDVDKRITIDEIIAREFEKLDKFKNSLKQL